MNDKKNTSKIVDELLDFPLNIKEVNSPPFFKDRVLNKLSTLNEKKYSNDVLFWFTPKYQIIALVLFAFLNLAVLYSYISDNKASELQTFAQVSGLSSSENNSILN
ncbi:hypothetical protein [Croceitalea rosinachiae]|uniref:Uncharacterized protein n=1 Tax=Croceitalea rosinachiae TaxID=3075596 RepID=A0ABU3A6J3_9FLAO|nr:hypothetical protein [Croceitalea sp. F388]MDT0605450.1 hypothetical protein [Croceitalea sp. F388]